MLVSNYPFNVFDNPTIWPRFAFPPDPFPERAVSWLVAAGPGTAASSPGGRLGEGAGEAAAAGGAGEAASAGVACSAGPGAGEAAAAGVACSTAIARGG